MTRLTLSAAEVADLRVGLLVHAGEVVDGLRRRFGDRAPAGPEQTRDAPGRWVTRLAERQACQPDRSVRLDAGELDALEHPPSPVEAAGLPGRLAQLRGGLTVLLTQAHAGPGPQVATLGGPADPGLPGPAQKGVVAR